MKFSKYYLSAFTAFLMWGFFSLALKPLHNFASLDILFYRVFFSAGIMFIINALFRRNIMVSNWNLFINKNQNQQRNILLLTFGGSVLLTLNWFVFIYVVNHVSVKVASLSYLICPLLTTVFAYFILNEKLSKWQWTAIAISCLSCILLSFKYFSDILYSFTVASTYALYMIIQRKNTEIDKFLLLTIQLIFTSIIILPFYPKYSGDLPTSYLFYGCLLIIVIAFTIIPLFLNLYALKGINSSAVGIMMYINPIINFILAVFYYKEPINTIQILSYCLILISIIVFNKKIIFTKRNQSEKI